MALERFIQWADEQGASDLHLESGLPAALRVRGELRMQGEPVSAEELRGLARELLSDAALPEFLERRSADFARTIRGVRCRINVLHSSRGIGLAIRLLNSPRATLKRLNLHPSLARLVEASHGLLVVSGPTGSGKTSTLAALLEEINANEARHIVTLEHPIEYALVPRKSFIRQREVGRDTPSFAQGLFDAMREDPDVLMVGEMREPEVMRLTLNTAETGHLVLATVHSASAAEALQRIVSAFPAEVQPAVCAQLADSLVGVIAQRLTYRADLGMRVPECEVLVASSAARAVIRSGQLYKLSTVLETGAADGSFSFARYRDWLAAKTDWVRQAESRAEDDSATASPDLPGATLDALRSPKEMRKPSSSERLGAAPSHAQKRPEPPIENPSPDESVLILDEEPEDLSAVLQELERRPRRR